MCGGGTSQIAAEIRFTKRGKVVDIFSNLLGLGLGPVTDQKKKACPARGPKQDREIFRGCMSRSPYKPQISSEDRVAVLWKSPTARNPDT